jgi:hypothetical protein
VSKLASLGWPPAAHPALFDDDIGIVFLAIDDEGPKTG